MRMQRSRLIGRLTEMLVSLHHTPKHTGGVRRIVYATRCTAAHLTHGRGIGGDGVGEKSVQAEVWQAAAQMITSFARSLWSFFAVTIVLAYVEMYF